MVVQRFTYMNGIVQRLKMKKGEKIYERYACFKFVSFSCKRRKEGM